MVAAPGSTSGAGRLAVAVCGETVADLVEQDDGRLEPVPGGSPANTALALARLGHDVTMLARLSSDVFGQRARARLESNAVDTSHAISASEPSTVAVVSVGKSGHPAYSFWTQGTADWQWSAAELAPHPRPRTTLLHTASVAAWLSPGEAHIEAMLRRARAEGVVISYDPNARPPLMPDLDEARARIEAKVALAHVVKVSDEDLDILQPCTDWEAAARRWLERGPIAVIVTRGSEGATVLRRGADPVSAAGPSVTVADTVGAGDTFTAGLWHGIAMGAAEPTATVTSEDLRDRLKGMTDADWRAALTIAATAAGVTCSRVGCDPPTAAEVAAEAPTTA
jgi:fructokinase